MKNLNEKPIISDFSELVYAEGMGTVMLTNLKTEDVFIVGYFDAYKRRFIIHQDITYPDYFMVSESSTGNSILDYCYETVEEAYIKAVGLLEAKRLHLATVIGNKLVQTQTNLNKRNREVLPLNTFLWI
jgi:hypothetical protein